METSGEMVLCLPIEIIASSSGLALQFGSSHIQIAYRSKKDFQNGKPLSKESKNGKLRFRLFENNEIYKIVEFIKEQVDFSRNTPESRVEVKCTGNEGHLLVRMLSAELNVRVYMMTESESVTLAFRALSRHLGKYDFLHSLPEKALREGFEVKRGFHEWLKTALPHTKHMRLVAPPLDYDSQSDAGELGQDHQESPTHSDSKEVKLPSLLVIAGSSTSYVMVDADGTHTIVDQVHPGRKSFMGLVHQLTGIKDFDVMISLARGADGRNLDIYASEFPRPPPGDEYPIYTWYGIDYNCFPFAKAVNIPQGVTNFGDMIYSVYKTSCHHIIQMARLNARVYDLKQIYFCGDFIDNDLARFNIFRDLLTHCTDFLEPPEVEFEEYQFLKLGGKYSQIGGFVSSTMK